MARAQLTSPGRKLPETIQASGKIFACADIGCAPVLFFKEGTKQVKGIDADIANSLSQVLGVKIEFVQTEFDGIIPALKTQRCQIAMSGITDTPERQAQGLDFVDYFRAGTTILVKKGNPGGITSLHDLCGKTIGLQRGTSQEVIAKSQAQRCKANGQGDLTIQDFDKETEALQQLKIGRTSADMNDFPVAVYNAQTSGDGNDFQIVPEIQGTVRPSYGIAILNTDKQLVLTLQEAMQTIIANGDYAKIMQAWHIEAGAVQSASINGKTV